MSRLTPWPSPAHQPRTASMAPLRALADGRECTGRPAHEAHLVDRADRAADQLPPDTRSMTGHCSRCSSGWCAAAPPAAPQRPCSHSYSGCTTGVPGLDIGRPAAQSRDVRCWCPLRRSSYPGGDGLPPVRSPHGRRLLAAASPGQNAPHCSGQCGRAEATLSFRFRLANGTQFKLQCAISRIAISRVIAW